MRLGRSLKYLTNPIVVTATVSALAGPAYGSGPVFPVPLAIANPSQLVEFDLHAMENLLQSQGYEVVSVDVTFLGRMRFVARNVHVTREVVVSRTTGAILRDVVTVNQTRPSAGNTQAPSQGAAQQEGRDSSRPLANSVTDTTDAVTGTVNNTVKSVVGTVGSVTDALGL